MGLDQTLLGTAIFTYFLAQQFRSNIPQKASLVSVSGIFCVFQQNGCSASSTAMCKEQIKFHYLPLISSKTQGIYKNKT